VIEELLAAEDAAGAPNYTVRAKGAELALKYKRVLDEALTRASAPPGGGRHAATCAARSRTAS
jgi:hypothetical protein